MSMARNAFKKHLQPLLAGASSADLCKAFAQFSRADLQALLPAATKDVERAYAFAVGMWSEQFCLQLAKLVIVERGLPGWDALQLGRTDAASVIRRLNGVDIAFTGNLALTKNSHVRLFVQCHEYVDATRARAVLGDAYLLRAASADAPLLRQGVEFAVFANVWEAAAPWRDVLTSSDLGKWVDGVFVSRPGKRNELAKKPELTSLIQFRDYLASVVR